MVLEPDVDSLADDTVLTLLPRIERQKKDDVLRSPHQPVHIDKVGGRGGWLLLEVGFFRCNILGENQEVRVAPFPSWNWAEA